MNEFFSFNFGLMRQIKRTAPNTPTATGRKTQNDQIYRYFEPLNALCVWDWWVLGIVNIENCKYTEHEIVVQKFQ